jgi:hypothetical protein
MPLEVSYSNRPFAAARKSTYVKGLRRESCQLKTAVRHDNERRYLRLFSGDVHAYLQRHGLGNDYD